MYTGSEHELAHQHIFILFLLVVLVFVSHCRVREIKLKVAR